MLSKLVYLTGFKRIHRERRNHLSIWFITVDHLSIQINTGLKKINGCSTNKFQKFVIDHNSSFYFLSLHNPRDPKHHLFYQRSFFVTQKIISNIELSIAFVPVPSIGAVEGGGGCLPLVPLALSAERHVHRIYYFVQCTTVHQHYSRTGQPLFANTTHIYMLCKLLSTIWESFVIHKHLVPTFVRARIYWEYVNWV